MTDKLIPSDTLAAKRRAMVPGESAAYAKARQDLLAEEIRLRRHITQVAGAAARAGD